MNSRRPYRRHTAGVVMAARVAFVAMPSFSCASMARVMEVPLSTVHAWTYRAGLRRRGLEESLAQIEALWRGTEGGDTGAKAFAWALLLGVQNAMATAAALQPREFAFEEIAPAVHLIPKADDKTVRDWLVGHVASLVPALDAANRRVGAARSIEEEAQHVAV